MARREGEMFRIREILNELKDDRAGATVMFIGSVRGGGQLKALHYEMYDEMATKCINHLKTEAVKKFKLTGAAVFHQKGRLRVGEMVVIVACTAPHRRDAFKACQWLTSEMKKTVPIWKKKV